MEKECWQQKMPSTPCFREAGSYPCESSGCTVEDRIKDLQADGSIVTEGMVKLLLHSVCRISSLSPDNDEFRVRTGSPPKISEQ